jgi:hypothetical protein
MKALTLTQPWATLVAIGAKRIETRSWRTSYRGRLAIHAAKGFPKWARDFTTDPVCYEAVRLHCAALGIDERLNGFPAYPVGAVLATCSLVNCIPTELTGRSEFMGVPLEGLTDQERAFGDFSDGRYAWILADVRMLPEPIPSKGALSLWEWLPVDSQRTNAKDAGRESSSIQSVGVA